MFRGSRIQSYKVIDFFELLFGVISLSSSLLSFIAFFQGKIDGLTFFFIVAVIAVFLAAFLKLLKFRQIASKRLKGFSSAFHAFSDTLRDEYYTLMSLYSKGKLDSEQLTRMAEATCQKAVDIIATAFTESTDEKVCVSIKYFPRLTNRRSFPKNMNVDDYMLATLCRSANSPTERQGHRLMRVGDNTGFQLIIKYQHNHFRTQDLAKYINEISGSGSGGFHTTNPNWERYYRSVITVPIRIRRSILTPPRGTSRGSGYHIIGLLCADSLSTSAFKGEEELDAYTNLLKSYADALYIYLERVDFYLSKVPTKK